MTHETSLPRRQRFGVAGAALLYALVASCGSLALVAVPDAIAPFWLANVGILALSARSATSARPILLGALWIGSLIANLSFGMSIAIAVALSAANALEVGLACFLLQRSGVAIRSLQSPRDLWAYLAIAAGLAPLASAVIASAAMVALSDARFFAAASRWFLADALGMAVFGPLMLTARRRDLAAIIGLSSALDLFLVLTTVGAVTTFVFSAGSYPLLFLILPTLTLAAFRTRFAGAALAVALVALIAAVATSRGLGPIAGSFPDAAAQTFFLQLFLTIATLATLPIASALAHRAHLARRLRDSERLHRLLAEYSNDMVVRCNLDGVRLYVSPASRRIVGFEPEEMTNQVTTALVHPDDRSRVERVARTMLDGVEAPVCSYRLATKGGGYVWVEATFRLVRDPVTGAPTEYVASVRDLRSRDEAEKAAAANASAREEDHRLLAMAKDLAEIGHWRLDARTGQLFWSSRVFVIYGRQPGDLPPLEQAIEVYHPDDRAMVEDHVARGLADGTPWKFEARLFRPDGTMRYVASSGQAERAPDGTILGLFGVFQDVTDRATAAADLVVARDEARAAADAKGAFLATMSHEIRTPMTGVLGMIGLLRADPDLPDRERYLDHLDQSANLLMRVLNDVLDFSKIESRNLVMEDVDFNFGEIVQRTVDLFHTTASRKGLLLTTSCPARDRLNMRGDPVRLQQVLSNLISNAIKFTAAGRVEVRVTAAANGTRTAIRCEVADTGPGIAVEDQSRLFEPFVQADASMARRFGGTGLGLAISRRLIEAMYGSIGVDSEVGRGATFYFTVELTTSRAPHKGQPDVRARPHMRSLSVLLAEDNAVNQALVSALIRRDGHRVTAVANGREAVEKAKRERFDLILMDMQMPELDGVAATREIRGGAGPNAQAPIIALTADATPERRALYDGIGLTEFLTKPVDTYLLSSKLEAIAAGDTGWNPGLPSHADDDIVLDERMLVQMERAIGVRQAHELVKLFIADARDRPTRIVELATLGSKTAAAQEAHSLKGSADGIGARRMARDARAIEQCEVTGDDQQACARALLLSARATLIALDDRSKRQSRHQAV